LGQVVQPASIESLFSALDRKQVIHNLNRPGSLQFLKKKMLQGVGSDAEATLCENIICGSQNKGFKLPSSEILRSTQQSVVPTGAKIANSLQYLNKVEKQIKYMNFEVTSMMRSG
jgi:hypothetical protein